MIRIAFSGIGGVGGYYRGMLAHFYKESTDIQIYFISRGKNLEVIQTQGLSIQTPQKEIIVHPALVTDKPEITGTVDYLFCTTKSYDLEENLRQLKPVIGPETVIIPLLNGADITERIRQLLPGQTVWYGCVYIGARLSSPGHITQFTERNRLWFGNPAGDHERQQQLLKILTDAGIAAVNPKDIIERIWKKFFLISVGATLTSYYNQSIGEILEFHRTDFYRLGAELKTIATAKGIFLPEDTVERVIEDQFKMPYDSTTSMHTDLKNGNRTELETLTGYVVRCGKEFHIPTPTYEKMYSHLKLRQ